VVTEGWVYSDTDGLVTDTPGLLLGVRVADCVPLLLFDPVRHAAGAVHCGWRPVAGGIAENAVKCMVERFGCMESDIRAATGPSAGPCCYEVSPDTAGHFGESSVITRNNSLYIDLKAEITKRLVETGIENNNIEHNSDCTICTPEDYFSYRRDGDASGRMMGFVMLKNFFDIRNY
jgi:YfiH family protein